MWGAHHHTSEVSLAFLSIPRLYIPTTADVVISNTITLYGNNH
jgi:hypothetical protein